MTDRETDRLRTELERAYRAVHAFANAHRERRFLDAAARAYHAPTVGAAARFVREGSLEGSEFFVGKHIDVLRRAIHPEDRSD